ncbi:transporter substrate-binding domain-containing protein [Saccharothrix sp. S26]|uniref:transporter substrate-binding domain-containing protein n=1 Tax=Saccharothrix sp. S26 TaxID=2907215 RepID=UPI001F2F1F26|nr:transporter substrate-binding domain-containing protein [Saccharothrix sp. S26]MCE6998455.1 transporter substrate-binding domain-containing protein [Saccharothrix sp. S26]
MVARRTWTRIAVVALVALTAAGCQWPRDADGTLDRVRDGTVLVGVAHNPPWTIVDDAGQAPDGVEPVLAQRLADSLGARVRWVPGGEAELMTALSERRLDLVVAGLDAESPWAQDVALTTDYFTADEVVAVPGGEPVDTGSHLSGLDHVMAVPPGENAWQTTVERFLLALDEDELRSLLETHRAGA